MEVREGRGVYGISASHRYTEARLQLEEAPKRNGAGGAKPTKLTTRGGG
jgi:hypothetical protein